jgi:SAM-dependent methyltransferase
MMTPTLVSAMECRQCRGELMLEGDALVCTRCAARHEMKDGAAIFDAAELPTAPAEVGDPLIAKLKQAFKPYNRLYYVLVRIAGALFVGKTGEQAFRNLPKGSIILNLGSGPKILSKDIVNVDGCYFPGVAVVAPAESLPFKTSSIDAIICECLLEHVPDPVRIVAEMERVIKPGGSVYVSIPFMDAYHSNPDDYYRWTTSGLKQLMSAFEPVELRTGFGPTSSFISAFANWIGVLLSFGSKTLYQLITLGLMVLLSPLKLLDYVLKEFPYATNSALGFYFIGKKRA